MKIAINAPVWLRVPPQRYGGTELVVSLLAEELVALGHEVHLFATGDSITASDLHSVYPRPQAPIGTTLPDALHSVQAYLQAEKFDIIHDHTGPIGAAYSTLWRQARYGDRSALIGTPVLATLHGDFNDQTRYYFGHFADSLYYNAISDYQRSCFTDLNYVDTVYNAINFADYRFQEKKEEFFTWVSRVSPQKAPHLAIKAAEALDTPIIMAGKVDPGEDTEYFHDVIEPMLDGDRVQFLGEVTHEEKIDLYARAKALLFPIQWAEPFGLVMAEALAAGTPVVTWRNGAAPEVIEDGLTGFVVDSFEAFVEAAGRVSEISPADCREQAEKRFSPARMAADYVTRYEQMIAARTDQPATLSR